ncbi:molybdate ABC transporter substrate-binding protein [Rahnella aquatilis]|jgi:molybdate transport system substrate-binding protein|nr:molybdate ABC transporter substrate-binding protein [Rahnella aquatilis]
MTKTIKVLAAGSLRRAWAPLCDAFTEETGNKIDVEFGPAGLLRERIEQGEKVDLFASANTAHPLTLQQHGKALEVEAFCGNSLCVAARKGPELEKLNWLSVLLDPRFRLATSTPQSDPSGDYTWQMFELIERRHPDAGAILRNKALRLVGGEKSAKIPAGKLAAEWLICSGQADVFIGYTSYATLLRENDALEVFNIPADYNVRARYALATCTEKGKPLADFILSETGQRILQNAGFCGRHAVMPE